MFLIQKTSRLTGGFNFVRIDLKLSVKVGTIFLCLGVIIFSFKWDFWRQRKMSSAIATRRRVEQPKTNSAKVFDGLLLSDKASC